jgi:hypothetical protein
MNIERDVIHRMDSANLLLKDNAARDWKVLDQIADTQ